MKKPLHLALLLPLTLGGCALSVEHQEAGESVTELELTVDRWAKEFLDDGIVAGLSVGIAANGETLLNKGYGLADIEQDVPATDDTVYRIGSITKQFTAAAMMRLVESGQIDLHAPIGPYVDFPTGDHTVTVEQLLWHTSGIPSYTGLGERWRKTVPLDVEHTELLGLVLEEPFDFAPGAEYRYNNTGYYLLGMIVENITGGSYADYVERELAAPLRLSRTHYCDEKRILPGRAEGYELVDGALVNDDPISMTQPFAAGALCSTVGDLLRWQSALASGEVVSMESYARMTSDGLLSDGDPIGYGYGLGLGDLEGHAVVRHGGGINGFATMLVYFPEDDVQITVLTNTPAPVAGPLTEKIARHMLDLEPAAEE